MGYKEFDIKVPVNAHSGELKNIIGRTAHARDFSFQIIKKSLDARNKKKICWLYRIGVISEEITGPNPPEIHTLKPEYRQRNKHVLIVGSGPAGMFSALLLILSGFKVTLVERGSNVESRKKAVQTFETTGRFNDENNYAFGEGGAGTFSDGKLTSRTKSIHTERNFIYDQFILAGAPEEILYMTHPHLGTDNLFIITQNLRKRLTELGCNIHFEQKVEDLKIKDNKVFAAITTMSSIEADYFIMATGHSAFETYRMLIRHGIPFQTKNFAIGFRAEHRREIINMAQWGVADIPGINAAEYRLTSETSDKTPVYSFCMCPGGSVVPATAYKYTNIVNGMSYYERSNPWSNAAVVVGINLEKYFGRKVSALETLDWLEYLESKYYRYAGGYNAPAASISSFLNNKKTGLLPESSYPFTLIETDFNTLLPEKLTHPLKEGLQQFCKKLKGYETGIILGLESKTSSPVQTMRDPVHLNSGLQNLFIAGEGSGWAGGIISSAADGLKIAQRIINL
jgi:uncharacterized FAD-dependent dehydrogenase